MLVEADNITAKGLVLFFAMKDSVENYTFLRRHFSDLIGRIVSKGVSWLVGWVVGHLGRRCVLERKCFSPQSEKGMRGELIIASTGFLMKFLDVVVKTARWYYIYIKVHEWFKTWQRIKCVLRRRFWCGVKRERCCFGEGGTIVLAAWAPHCFSSSPACMAANFEPIYGLSEDEVRLFTLFCAPVIV